MKRETFHKLFPLSGDREIARGPMIAADHLSVLLLEPLDKVCKEGEILARGLLQAQKLYQSDFIIIFTDVSVEAEAMGVKLKYYPHQNPQPISHLEIPEIKSTDISGKGRLPELFRAGSICRNELGKDFTIFFSLKDPFSLGALALGAEKFLADLILNPDEVTELIKLGCEIQLKLVEKVILAGFVPFIGAPMASGGLIGSENFRRFVAPSLAKMFKLIRARGSFACLHICGEIANLTPHLSKLKIDLLSFEDASILSQWRLLPETIPMGYVSTSVFLGADKERVRSATEECRLKMPKPMALSSGCDLPAKANPALVKVFMNYGMAEYNGNIKF